MKGPRLVEVTWKDAYHDRGWHDKPDVAGERMVQVTAGYITRRTSQWIHIAQTIDTQDKPRFADVMVIRAEHYQAD